MRKLLITCIIIFFNNIVNSQNADSVFRIAIYAFAHNDTLLAQKEIQRAILFDTSSSNPQKYIAAATIYAASGNISKADFFLNQTYQNFEIIIVNDGSDEENSKLVSPSFVIASRLGAVLSTYSGLGSMSNDKKLIAFADHCKNYVEVDDLNDDKKDPVEVHDNWRLPTEAEIRIIIDIQGASGVNADAIDYLLNGAYYMSASGPVYNPKNADNEAELADPMKATDVAIRCVRDAF